MSRNLTYEAGLYHNPSEVTVRLPSKFSRCMGGEQQEGGRGTQWDSVVEGTN